MTATNRFRISAFALCVSMVSGCATMEENQQAMGAAGGAAVGCIAGLLIGGHGADCAKGAVIGGALGWGAVKVSQYQEKKVRSANEDRRVYGLTQPANDTVVKIRRGTVTPETVKPGQKLKLVTDYSLLLPKGVSSTQVAESWVITKDGKPLTEPEKQLVQRDAGGYAVGATIDIPASAAPGTYVIETKVEAGTSYDVDQSVFVVES
jgi:hypothetical protein